MGVRTRVRRAFREHCCGWGTLTLLQRRSEQLPCYHIFASFLCKVQERCCERPALMTLVAWLTIIGEREQWAGK